MSREAQAYFVFVVAAGLTATGVLAFFLQRHPIRRRAWLPIGFLLLFIAVLFAGSGASYLLVGAVVGSGLGALAASCRRRREADAGLYLTTLVMVWTTAALAVTQPIIELYGAVASGVAFLITLYVYRRSVGECLLEWPIRVMYRIRAVGPGMKEIPRTGPVLVIANHATFLDPCWIMIRIPRDLTPIMYGEYFNKPGVHFYMKHLINAIPSGVGHARREVPELDEVVRRLDRGEGVLIFPEGWVRRKADEELRRFAQGTWRILREQPATPVVACWIEGGWGSWTSFWNGPPLKGKRIDFRRPITIYVAAPVGLDPETLGDQQSTREKLRQMVLDARAQLQSHSR